MGPKRTKAERLKISGISLLVIGLVFFLSGLISFNYPYAFNYRYVYTLHLYGIIGLGLGCPLFTIGVGLWGGSRRKVKMIAMKNKSRIALIVNLSGGIISILLSLFIPVELTRFIERWRSGDNPPNRLLYDTSAWIFGILSAIAIFGIIIKKREGILVTIISGIIIFAYSIGISWLFRFATAWHYQGPLWTVIALSINAFTFLICGSAIRYKGYGESK